MNTQLASFSANERKRLEWYLQARFGMFIHWGIYSASGSGECLTYRSRIRHEDYRKFADKFHAGRYNPGEWASIAREAGMKYMVLTAKHLDGFCLFDTKTTDFNAVKIGPMRDLVAPYVKACRGAGLKVGLYYNLRDLSHPAYDYGPGDMRWKPYVERVHAQFREILTQYGKIDLLWIDQTSPEPLIVKNIEAEKLGRMIRRLQPDIIISRAFGEKGFGDFDLHEQHVSSGIHGRLWELCDTFNNNWGYHGLDHDWKSLRHIAGNLAMCAHNGGNYLLNVGPKPDGTIPGACVSRLREIGRWTERNREAIYGVEPHPFDYADQTLSVARGNTAYVFLPDAGTPCRNRPSDGCVIAGIGNKMLSVNLLGSAKPLYFSQKDDLLFITLPKKLPDSVLSVLKLKLDGKPCGVRSLWWHCGTGPLSNMKNKQN